MGGLNWCLLPLGGEEDDLNALEDLVDQLSQTGVAKDEGEKTQEGEQHDDGDDEWESFCQVCIGFFSFLLF